MKWWFSLCVLDKHNKLDIYSEKSHSTETHYPDFQKRSTCRKSLTNFITKCCIEYTSPWTGFKLPDLVVIGTDCTDSYYTITTMMDPEWLCCSIMFGKKLIFIIQYIPSPSHFLCWNNKINNKILVADLLLWILL